MFSYLIRRVLLFFPTLIGATFLVFGLLSVAPIKITNVLLPPGGDLRPGVREQREAYLNERYGLKDPLPVRYLRWLNNASPVGLQVWKFDEPTVVETRARRRAWRSEVEAQIKAEGPTLDGEALIEAIDKAEREAQKRGDVNFKPRPGQFRFERWWWPFKKPDLGQSYIHQRPAHELILQALPITLLLNFLSLPIAVAIAVITGVWAAKHRGRWPDWGTGGVLLALSSIPQIWVGVLFIGFLCNVEYVRWFPPAGLESLDAPRMTFFPSKASDGSWISGYLLDATWHLVLPVICLTYAQFAYLSKISRTSMLEVLGSDYVRTARAKGAKSNVVLWRHAFRNALIPIITVLAALLPAIVAGSVVVETIFSINGMGQLLIESLKRGDNEVFLSLTLITLLLTVTAYLMADIAYALADPRVSYE